MKWKQEGCKNPTAKGSITVESQDNDPNSLLNWTRSLISMRKSTPAFWGDSSWKPLIVEDNAYPMMYLRSDGNETYFIALNPTSAKKTVNVGQLSGLAAGKTLEPVLMSGKASYKATKKGDVVTMNPVSAVILKIK